MTPSIGLVFASMTGPDAKRPRSELRQVLESLALFKSDPNFRNQAFNHALIAELVMNLEVNFSRQQVRAEPTPAAEATFASAQSQKWIFAAIAGTESQLQSV
jgi:hypothetical protein